MMMTESSMPPVHAGPNATETMMENGLGWAGQMTALPERDRNFVQEIIRLLTDPERHQEGEWLRQGCAVIKCDPRTGAVQMHLHLGAR